MDVSKVRAKGTTWCIHVLDAVKLGQNGLKMCQSHLFVHPTHLTHSCPIFAHETSFKAFWAKMHQRGVKLG